MPTQEAPSAHLRAWNGRSEAVRAARAAHPGKGVTVTVNAGRYELSRPLEFTAADSGASAERPVRYIAAARSEVVISGGKKIEGWHPDPERQGVSKAHVGEDNWRFEQLCVNGRRAIRARTPNYWEFFLLRGVTDSCMHGRDSPLLGLAALSRCIRFSVVTGSNQLMRVCLIRNGCNMKAPQELVESQIPGWERVVHQKCQFIQHRLGG